KDGRYGETPNGLQHYYQFQVILKPSPDDIQELYLQSLAEIGLDSSLHDIRFVEDDWESPTLGAWGLGWECWCDGMEVSQFTYFQQVAGFETKPVPGEITYGLERLAMYVQGGGERQGPKLKGRWGRGRGQLGRRFPAERAGILEVKFRGRRYRHAVPPLQGRRGGVPRDPQEGRRRQSPDHGRARLR